MSTIMRALRKVQEEKHGASFAPLQSGNLKDVLARAGILIDTLLVNPANGTFEISNEVNEALEEVDHLKEKLLEIHEKQELPFSRSNTTLSGLKNVLKSNYEEPESVHFEDFDTGNLEDLIFIGRKRG